MDALECRKKASFGVEDGDPLLLATRHRVSTVLRGLTLEPVRIESMLQAIGPMDTPRVKP